MNSMDNGFVTACGCRPESLRQVIALAVEDRFGVSWEEQGEWLVVYWHSERGTRLPVRMDAHALAELSLLWLQQWKPSAPAPQLDGSVSRGWEFSGQARRSPTGSLSFFACDRCGRCTRSEKGDDDAVHLCVVARRSKSR